MTNHLFISNLLPPSGGSELLSGGDLLYYDHLCLYHL